MNDFLEVEEIHFHSLTLNDIPKMRFIRSFLKPGVLEVLLMAEKGLPPSSKRISEILLLEEHGFIKVEKMRLPKKNPENFFSLTEKGKELLIVLDRLIGMIYREEG
ncbi:MAG: hypothetical protein DRO11_00125 [Methanobacteriota archaeon]|nr:MAG: hypothetical protein DRO11_00125 [Euryarchaeota archaeon]